MNTVRHILQLLILAASLLAPLQSSALVTGVTVEPASVRASPNGAVVDSLRTGTAIGVLTVSGEWAQVMYFAASGSKEVKTGWVGLRQVQMTSGGGASGGGECETEYKTGAEVCVTVRDTDLYCRKDYSGEYYRSCEVSMEYNLSTNYSGRSYLEVEVDCEVEIKYMGREMYSWRSDSASENESHTLYAHGSESDSLTFDFSFSSFKEVNRVKIDSIRCKIDSVNLW